MRRLADSTDPAAVPDGFDLYGGYINGAWQSYLGMVARFGADKVLGISTNGDPTVRAPVYDFERGNYRPDQAVVVRRNNPDGTFYANRSDWAQIGEYLGVAGMTLPPWWAATLDGTQGVAGAVAVQWIDHGAYDESVIYNDLWYPTGPPPDEEDDVLIWGSDNSDTNMRIVDGRMAHIRFWWLTYRGTEPSVDQQNTAYNLWAQRGGDLVLAGIKDGTLN